MKIVCGRKRDMSRFKAEEFEGKRFMTWVREKCICIRFATFLSLHH
jgi:hypothetical protein